MHRHYLMPTPLQTALLKINPRETITTPSFVVQLTVQWLQAQ